MKRTLAPAGRGEIAPRRAVLAAALLALCTMGPGFAQASGTATCSPSAAPSPPSAQDPWYGYWKGKSVAIKWPFGDGGAHLKKKNGKLGRIKLRALVTTDSNNMKSLIRFHVRFWFRGLKYYWRGAHLTPRGSMEPTINVTLEPWRDDPDVLVAYRNALGRLVAQMQKESLPGDRDYYRLESLFSVGGQGTVGVDVLRLALLRDAVCENGTKSDLAVFAFGYLEGSAVGAQDGGGSGPPIVNEF